MKPNEKNTPAGKAGAQERNELRTQFSHFHFTTVDREHEPEYTPDWLAIEQTALLMLDYWQHIAEIARIEQILENIDGRGLS